MSDFKISPELREEYPEYACIPAYTSGSRRSFVFSTRYICFLFKRPFVEGMKVSMSPKKASAFVTCDKFDRWILRFTDEMRPADMPTFTAAEKLQKIKEKLFIRAYVYVDPVPRSLPCVTERDTQAGTTDICIMRVTPVKLAQKEVGWVWVPPYTTDKMIETSLARWEIDGMPGKYYCSFQDVYDELVDLIVVTPPPEAMKKYNDRMEENPDL